jgi:integration host factor subunit alpha
MALTKSDIIQKVTKETDLPKSKSGHVVEQFLETIKRTLASGDDVLIGGFGRSVHMKCPCCV